MTQRDPILPLRHMLDFAERAIRAGAGKSADEIAGDELLSMALPHMLEMIGEAATASPKSYRKDWLTFPGGKSLRCATG